MRIALIGGIYGQGGVASQYLRVTPETTLEAGLREAGHEVTTLGHYAEIDFAPFDLVHVHHLSYGALRLASDPSRTPFAFTVHDASQMSGASLGAVRTAALRYVLSRADQVVTLSRGEADFHHRVNGVERSRLATVPNGIDAGRFQFVRRNACGRGLPWQILFVGQLIPLKGCDLILRAVAALPHVELTLVYQNADLKSQLESLAGELRIRQRVHFAGRRDPEGLAELYQQSDLLVLASETEALPSVITEAMLSGLPFVSVAVGGIREQAAGFGHLLEERSVESIAAGIAHVIGNYSQFVEAAPRMHEHARNTYSIPAMVRGHLDLYVGMAGRHPRRLRPGYRLLNRVVRAIVHHRGTTPRDRRARGVETARTEGS